jgi:hypothetical protein
MHLPVTFLEPACRHPLLKIELLLDPAGLILRAFRASAFRCFCTAGHLDPFSVDQSIGDLAPGFVEIAPSGLAGDPEFLGSFFLFEPFEIDEPYQFDLIGLQGNASSFLLGTTAWLIAP